MAFAPTAEQVDIVDAARTEQDMIIEAGAGTGKTSTLRLLAADAPKDKILYVAYNKSVQVEAAASFASNVSARTAHSLAYGGTIRKYGNRVRSCKFGGIPVGELTQKLNICDLRFGPGSDAKPLEYKVVAELAVTALTRFCGGGDTEVSEHHVPRMPGLSEPDIAHLRGYVAGVAGRAWADYTDPRGQLTFTPAVYLKLWQLSNPTLRFDKVLFDEAQDANGAMAAVVNRQNTQRIVVGDRCQALYEWNGAIDAMAKWSDWTTRRLTQCQPEGTLVRIPGEPLRTLNSGSSKRIWRDVPIESIRAGDRVVSWGPKYGIVKRGRTVNDVNIRPYDGLLVVASAGGKVSRYAPNHECVVVLGDTLTEGNNVVYLMRRGGQFRIGRCPWRYANGVAPIRRAVREEADALWVLSVHETESDAALHEALTQVQFGIPGAGWAQPEHYKMPLCEFWLKVGDNSAQAMACLTRHGLLIDHPLWTRSAKPLAGWSTKVVTAAANIRGGMRMLVADSQGVSNGSTGGYIPWSSWTAIEVSREWYSGLIYSLSVEVDHTYVADGIVTHNSFRFGPEIADQANLWLDYLDADLRLTGLDSIGSRVVDEMPEPTAVLCRTNMGVIDAALRQLQAGRATAVVGGVGEAARLAQAAADLRSGRRPKHPDLAGFRSWGEFLDFVNNDPDGRDFAVLVALVETYGTDQILMLQRRLCAKEPDAEVTISTGHKAKGREWSRVLIARDFAPRDSDSEDSTEPLFTRAAAMLAYVAVTRARDELCLGPLAGVL